MVHARQKISTELKAKTQTSPGLLMLSKLLMLTNTELEQQIEQELQENPALEKPNETETALPTEDDFQMKIFFSDPETRFERPLETDDEENDTLSAFASGMSLRDHLLSQLIPALPENQHELASYMVDSLDEHGYLNVELEEIALRFKQPLETMQEVLRYLQNCDPPGIGARHLQECLVLQVQSILADVDANGDLERIQDAERILTLEWDDFTRDRKGRVMRRLRLTEERFLAATEYIRHHLTPYPAAGFQTMGMNGDQSGVSVEPDVLIKSSLSGLEIEIRGMDINAINLNPYYWQQYRRISQGTARLTQADREHICHYVERAQLFLNAIRKRRETLLRVVQLIVETQQNFFVTGDIRFVQPITRAEVAERIGLHRSTVGRAVRNKFIQMPNGQVVSFDLFFKAAHRVAMLINQILQEHEADGRKLTDVELTKHLAAMGIEVSRRAVAKYRGQYRILSSRWR